MIPFLYDVTDRSGNLVIGNATFAEIVEGLNCSKAQANNARTSGDLIFRKYEMHRVDRKLSRGFNTSHVTLYLRGGGSLWTFSVVSIHLMLLFIRLQDI